MLHLRGHEGGPRGATHSGGPRQRRRSFSSLRKTIVAAALLIAASVFVADIRDLHSLLHVSYAAPAACPPTRAGSWGIGTFYGASPLALQPLEWHGAGSPWRNSSAAVLSNPVVSCHSALNESWAFTRRPSLLQRNGALYVFFEARPSQKTQGVIAAAVSQDAGATWAPLGTVLQRPWHLTSPYVFEHGSEVFLLPEGAKGGSPAGASLYRAADFPFGWTRHSTLLAGRSLGSAAIVQRDGTYWLFASDNTQALRRGLLIYHATSPLGPWTAHQLNPFASALHVAGRLIEHHGKLLRLGRRCGRSRGDRVVLLEVTQLSAKTYAEEPVSLSMPLGTQRGAWNAFESQGFDALMHRPGHWVAAVDGDSRFVDRRFNSLLHHMATTAACCSIVVVIASTFLPFLPPPKAACAAWRGCLRVLRRLRPPRQYHTAARPLAAFAGLALLLAALVYSFIGFMHLQWHMASVQEDPRPIAVGGAFSKFTLLVMTYSARLHMLHKFVGHYSHCASVLEILVVWNKGQVPQRGDLESQVPIRIRVEQRNSLNNRFRPDAQLRTQAVLSLDDDIFMPCSDLERGFAEWRQHPGQLVGFHPRLAQAASSSTWTSLATRAPLRYLPERTAVSRGQYNLILTGSAFIDAARFFPLYSAAEVQQHTVDELFNCEDVLMNFVVANTTQPGVSFVRPRVRIDLSFTSGVPRVSGKTQQHQSKRDICLDRFSEAFAPTVLQQRDFAWGKRGPPFCRLSRLVGCLFL